MKKLTSFLLAMSVATSLVGCGNASGTATTAAGTTTAVATTTEKTAAETTTTETTTTDKEFVVGAQAMPSGLNANADVSNSGNQIYYNIYDTLIFRDTNADELVFIPGLATSWKTLEGDDLTWEIKLREGVKFHDGTTMTAEDVAYSMNRVINLDEANYATAKSYLLSNFTEFEVVDDLTIHAHTVKPEPLFEHLMSDPNAGISCKAYCEEVGYDQANLMPITTAPYKVVSFDPGQEAVLERFDEYWGETAPFKKVTFKLVPEIISRVTAIQNGEVDMVTNIPPEQEVMLEGNADVTLIGDVLPMYHIYRFDCSNPVVDDVNLRQALKYAIDRDALNQAIWGGKAEVPDSYQYEEYGEPLYVAENENLKYDLELAKEYLAKSDYNGEVVDLQMVGDYYTNSDIAGLAVVDMWAELGVNAKVTEVESWSGLANESLRCWSNPLYYVDPMGNFERHWAPDGASHTSGQFIVTDEYRVAFETARYSMDLDERAEAISDMLDYFDETAQFIYLYKPYESYAVGSDVNYEIPANTRAYTIGLRAGQISVN